MEVSAENAGQSMMDLKCEKDSLSMQDGDSNALILPAKRTKKRKGMNADEMAKMKKCPKLSKSQKRKLIQLEEEKQKAFLLSKSIENLEKYKISEDAHSLLRSSKNISRVETVKEKHRMAVQFSKLGLEVPSSDQYAKIKSSDESCESEPGLDESHIRQDRRENDSLRPIIVEREVLDKASYSFFPSQWQVCSNDFGLNGGYVADQPPEELPSDEIVKSIQEDARISSLSLRSCDEKESSESRSKLGESLNANVSKESNLPNSLQQGPCRPSTVVHVSRPSEIENQRIDLPIVMMEQEIMEAINENSTVIVCGETGCGKTTQVPQFLYEAGFGSKHYTDRSGIIGVTQPRRVAVLATAKRVAFELGFHLGKEVGFQVRHDKRIGDKCSIKFMTDGILLREVQNDFLLKRYSVIILDEAHERSLNTDILIGMLSRIIQLRQDLFEKQQKLLLYGQIVSPEDMIFPLKLVMMSATLRVEDFISGKKLFRNPPPVVEVPTRQFPVTVHFSKKTEIVDYIGQAYKKVLAIHKRLPPGGILVFVTGQREVEYLCSKLRKASWELIVKSDKGKEENNATAVSNLNSTEEINTKEINEAFDVHGNSNYEQTDRFSSYDEDQYDYEDESDDYHDSETDSDLEYTGEGGSSLDQKTPDDDLVGVLGEEMSLASLKASFEALAGNSALDSGSEGQKTISVTPKGCSELPKPTGKNKCGDTGRSAGALCVLPLYAMLPAAAQLRVFEEIKEGERLVVVATNVAETSLTIPGIKYVVDTGREKVKNYNSTTGMETFEICWISKASAAQRAGRAGRTGPGHCYRLYSSAVFTNILSDFSCAEISKIPVDGVVLIMKSMGIDKVGNFPFPTPPNAAALVEADRCLKALEALDSNGRLTPLGKAMSHYPMSPRHSRMLLTVIQIMRKVKSYSRANLILGYAVAAAAALSLSNPFVRQFEGTHNNQDDLEPDQRSTALGSAKIAEKQEKSRKKKLKETAKISRAKFSNPSSDALSVAYALQCFELSNSPVEFCNDNALYLKTMEEMSKLRKQLLQLVFHQSINYCSEQDFRWTHGSVEDVEQVWRVLSSKNSLLLQEEELLRQAICAGWADRVAKRIKGISVSSGDRKANAVRYQSSIVKETVFLHRWSSLSNSAPEFLVYSELLHTKRSYLHGATSVKPEWLVRYAGSLCSFSAPLTNPKPYYDPNADQLFSWVIPTFGPQLWQLPLHSLPINGDVHRVTVFAYALLKGHVLPCLKSVRRFMAAPPASILKPEAKGQRRVGNLLFKLKTKSIDSCAKLRETWKGNPKELYPEILDWFQEGYNSHFEALWLQMLGEVVLEPCKRFPKSVKRHKRKSL
ncbi:ATP-dependent RNA helicase DEAH13 isoform X1 [Tripterygium wilfordii]|uniref:ATP-dependent RNA helicase DEAH13 isoform X1 n=1 Tax=Tripterygium wilfordii TaxID=458696 RepID=UPI0018F82748|nr:ATP-dependent RNA helicase DEAH13 isoform X1 [Tripterygium wilfordii]